jgi:choline dehydrogenase-like flavoprotein
VAFGVVYLVHAADTVAKLISPFLAIWHILLFFLFKLGLFASMMVKQAIWVRSGAIDQATMTVQAYGQVDEKTHDNMDATDPENIPDIEYMLIPGSADFKAGGGKAYNSLLCTLTQPFAQGTIELASTDPLAAPVLRYPLLTDPRDLRVARTAVRFAMNFVQVFRTTGYPFETVWDAAPGVKQGTVDGSWQGATDDEIDAYVKTKVRGIYHPTSSCRMAAEERGGVVGQDLKVHGFKNLRIADASVFPKISTAHPMATVLMIAERCADIVGKDWGLRT